MIHLLNISQIKNTLLAIEQIEGTTGSHRSVSALGNRTHKAKIVKQNHDMAKDEAIKFVTSEVFAMHVFGRNTRNRENVS